MPRKTYGRGYGRGRGVTASMRPRPDAAENLSRPAAESDATAGFNEAAARCRGKRVKADSDTDWAIAASMRPRPDAAENSDN